MFILYIQHYMLDYFLHSCFLPIFHIRGNITLDIFFFKIRLQGSMMLMFSSRSSLLSIGFNEELLTLFLSIHIKTSYRRLKKVISQHFIFVLLHHEMLSITISIRLLQEGVISVYNKQYIILYWLLHWGFCPKQVF